MKKEDNYTPEGLVDLEKNMLGRLEYLLESRQEILPLSHLRQKLVLMILMKYTIFEDHVKKMAFYIIKNRPFSNTEEDKTLDKKLRYISSCIEQLEKEKICQNWKNFNRACNFLMAISNARNHLVHNFPFSVASLPECESDPKVIEKEFELLNNLEYLHIQLSLFIGPEKFFLYPLLTGKEVPPELLQQKWNDDDVRAYYTAIRNNKRLSGFIDEMKNIFPSFEKFHQK